jgi:hypothetical protein
MQALVVFLQSAVSVLAILSASALVGHAILKAMPFSAMRAAGAAAPVVGFGWICVVATVAYRFGVPAGRTAALLLIPIAAAAIFWIFNVGLALARRPWQPVPRLFWACVAAVFLLALLPPAIGGLQFAIFQGNPYDSLNYLGLAVATDKYPYAYLIDLPAGDRALTNFLASTSGVLGARPAIAIGYAVASRAMFDFM